MPQHALEFCAVRKNDPADGVFAGPVLDKLDVSLTAYCQTLFSVQGADSTHEAFTVAATGLIRESAWNCIMHDSRHDSVQGTDPPHEAVAAPVSRQCRS